jgi:hypothetical protein
MTFIVEIVQKFGITGSMQAMQVLASLACNKKFNEINDESDASNVTPTGGGAHLACASVPRCRPQKVTGNGRPHEHFPKMVLR